MAPFPGNPANSLIRPERPENKNAGDSQRRECMKPLLKGSPKVIPHLSPKNGTFSGKSGEFFNSAGETGK